MEQPKNDQNNHSSPVIQSEYDDRVMQHEDMLQKLDWLISNRHLSLLSSAQVVPYEQYIREYNAASCFRLFPIREIIYDKTESIAGKLRTVYSGCASAGVNPVMIIEHCTAEANASFYLGACGETFQPDATAKADVFKRNLLGNFPGCRFDADGEGLFGMDQQDKLIDQCISGKYAFLSCVSAVASERGDVKQDESRAFIQGIERVVNAMEDQCYTMLVISRSLSNQEISEMQAQYENLYNALYPYLKTSYSISSSNAISEGNSLSKSISDVISNSITRSKGTTESTSKGHTDGANRSEADSTGTQSGHSAGGNAGLGIKEVVSLGGFYAYNKGHSDSHTTTRGNSWSDTFSKGYSSSEQEGTTATTGKTITVTEGKNRALTITEGEAFQLFYENKIIQGLLTALEQKIKRLREGKAQGMFETAAYFLAKDQQNAEAIASIYKASITGDQTFIEESAINTWSMNEHGDLRHYLRHCQHPVFQYEDFLLKATSVVTAQEHAIQFSLPRSSVNGLHVDHSVAFARNITVVERRSTNRKAVKCGENAIMLGNLYHLGKQSSTPVHLDLQSLSSHGFVSGTTGSGKSNTVYWMLDQLRKVNPPIHFLVIEPAKGDYKQVFGDAMAEQPRFAGRPVAVYGTNPALTPLLRINPFSFPQGIHVLEHIDRICAIFNVCWPMEAAMPSILKQAVTLAYQNAGWNLKFSRNRYDCRIYPSFFDVKEQIHAILDSSEYSSENKGDYKGALCTRLNDLTTDLNSLIFCSDDLSDESLFERDVIVDLSRMKSEETKSLIMGLLVIRLEEYRQSQADGSNLPLRHVTVLEEAHNLLKRTSKSSAQSSDKANVVGKSVEMLSNALAEMRSSGEGFLIVDQSPEQVDISAIRNTNTKIVLRLPVYSDRKEIGRSMGLNDVQIDELARLPNGVAAVYQNNWKAAVLVGMERFDGREKRYIQPDGQYSQDDEAELLKLAAIPENRPHLIDQLVRQNAEDTICRKNIPLCCKKLLLAIDSETEPESSIFDELTFELLHVRELAEQFLAQYGLKNLPGIIAADLWTEALQTRAEALDLMLTDHMLLEMTRRIYTKDTLFADCYTLLYQTCRELDGIQKDDAADGEPPDA